jgi:dienelactone hydrolase
MSTFSQMARNTWIGREWLSCRFGYDAQAAKLAWSRTVEFFKSRLARGPDAIMGRTSENKVR